MHIVLLCMMVYPLIGTEKTIGQQFFTQYFTDSDCSSWTITGPHPAYYLFSNCGSDRIFGGYGVFTGTQSQPLNTTKITKTYSNIIPHFKVRIRARIYLIDSWLQQSLFVMVDGVTKKLYTWNSSDSRRQICGDQNAINNSINRSYNDKIIEMDIQFNHSIDRLQLTIISNLNSGSGSWGIKNLLITISLCDYSCASCLNYDTCSSCNPNTAQNGAYCDCNPPNSIQQRITNCDLSPCMKCVTPTTCSIGYYFNSITQRCQACNSACSQCSSSLNTVVDCSQCSNDYYMGVIKCQPCSVGCANCNNPISCSACKLGYFLQVGQCKTQCGIGFYGEQYNRICKLCSSPCLECQGNSSNHCLSCQNGYLFHEKSCILSCPNQLVAYNGFCYNQCPSYTFQDNNKNCSICRQQCIECTNETNCIECIEGTYLLNNKCLYQCPSYYYGSQIGLCIQCNQTCLTCNGTTQTDCLSCIPGKLINNGKCYIQCPSSTYYNIKCQQCHQNCLECNGSQYNNCISCNNYLHLNYSICIQQCQIGQIQFNYTCSKCLSHYTFFINYCIHCHPTCQQCNGIYFFNCLSCQNHLIFNTNTCLSNGLIYTPHLHYQGWNVYPIILINICFCIIIQFIFTHKTNLILMMELFQVLSYSIYLSVSISSTMQALLIQFYQCNLTFWIPVSIQEQIYIPPLFQLTGKTGYYAVDSIAIRVILYILAIIYLFTRRFKDTYPYLQTLYSSINPYILTYSYRLLMLQHLLITLLFLSRIDKTISTVLGTVSLIFLLIDIISLMLITILWKIKTDQDGKQYALFFENQIGSKNIQQSNFKLVYFQKLIKSTLIRPHLIPYLNKLLIVLPIFLFSSYPMLQTASLFAATIIINLLAYSIPYRRTIYKLILLLCSAFILLNALFFLLIQLGFNAHWWVSLLHLIAASCLLFLTGMQVITNYLFFWQFLKGLKEKLVSSNKIANSSNLKQSAQNQQISNSKNNSLVTLQQYHQNPHSGMQ